MTDVLNYLRRTVLARVDTGRTDGQLLRDYVSRRDEAALAAIVRRHAAMVWGVCRRVLRDHHDAEDAFQATFMVLVRRAAAIASPDLVASWLYGVAHQTALKRRSLAARRKSHEKQFAELPDRAAAEQELWTDLQPLLDRELSCLPEKYRSAIVLCELEGKTRAEAARQLGVPDGTLAARLARARVMLATRLARRGVSIPAAMLTVLFARDAASAASPPVTSTLKCLLGTHLDATSASDASRLADEVSRGMSAIGFKKTWLLSLTITAVALGAIAFQRLGHQIEPRIVSPQNSVAQSAPLAPRLVLDREKLQGTWRVVASEMDGVKDFDRGLGHDRLVFTGERVTYWTPKGPQEGRFRLTRSSSLAEIDIAFDGGSILRGIYEFDADRLRFCWIKGGARPTSFDTSTGEILTFLYTYVKQH